MKRFKPQHPFSDFAYAYKSKNRDGRAVVELFHKGGVNSKFVTLARYRMCVKLGRVLDRKEQVDHKDGDKTNDTTSNLQILSGKENSKKSIRQRGIELLWLRMKCPTCRSVFCRPKNKSHVSKGGLLSFCGLECSHSFKYREHTKKGLKAIGKKQIIEEFRHAGS